MEGQRLAVGFETGRHYRVHKSYYLLGPVLAAGAVIVVVLLNSLQGIVEGAVALRRGGVELNVLLVAVLVVVGIVVVYGIVLAIYVLGYRRMSYVFDEGEFSFYSGILARREVHLPYGRIQSVNHRASILQRLGGVCTVSIDSAGGARNKALRVPYLRLATAEQLRVDLFVRKAAAERGMSAVLVYDPALNPDEAFAAQGVAQAVKGSVTASGPVQGANVLDSAIGAAGEWRGAFGGVIEGLEEPAFSYGLSNRELLLTCVSHGGPLILGVIVAAFGLVGAAPLLAVERAYALLGMLLVPLVILVAVVSWALGMLGTALNFGNFKCCRRGSRIEVEQGLLQRRFTGIDVERVQYVEIRQTFVRRLMGYCELSLGRVRTAEEGNGQNKGGERPSLVIHPFVRLKDIDRILAGLAPEFSGMPRASELIRLPASATVRACLRYCIVRNPFFYVALAVVIFVVAVGANGLFADQQARLVIGAGSAAILVACAAYTACALVAARRWARTSGYVWNRSWLMLRNGGFRMRTIAVPRQKIQSGSARSGLIQRSRQLETIKAVTAAGTGSTAITLRDLPQEASEAYLRWLRPRRA